MRTRPILERMYRVRRRPRSPLRLARELSERIVDWVADHNWRLALGGILLAVWLGTHIYYYNQLVFLEFDVKAAWAQVEVSRARRSHIQRNLRQLIRHYAGYEQKVMTALTETRMGKEPVATADRAVDTAGDGSPLAGLLGRLQVIAEQYPNLHLTNTTQQVSSAVIASETDIALRIGEYNSAVNRYTTVLSQFPGRLFGAVLGFEAYDFYHPEDEAVLEFSEIEL